LPLCRQRAREVPKRERERAEREGDHSESETSWDHRAPRRGHGGSRPAKRIKMDKYDVRGGLVC